MQKNKEVVDGYDDVISSEVLDDIKEKIEILLIEVEGNILFPLRVMYKRNTNKINIIIVALILFMIFIFFKNLYDAL